MNNIKTKTFRIKNSTTHYGLLNVSIHWLTVLLIGILFPLGLIMVDLSYYDSGYKTYPHIHKSLGLILLGITLFRILWVYVISKPPQALAQPRLLALLAKLVHYLLYLCLLAILVSGYLISTADGRGIDVFNWFTLPALLTPFDGQADLAGEIHKIAAWVLMSLITLHVMGALKHHVINKDRTLLRILGR